jgi:hypothetical protein
MANRKSSGIRTLIVKAAIQGGMEALGSSLVQDLPDMRGDRHTAIRAAL